MLSYALIILACGAVFVSKLYRRAAAHEEGLHNQEADPEIEQELIQAVARYEASDWQMAVATDEKMSQSEWDHVLMVLTNNIDNLRRVV